MGKARQARQSRPKVRVIQRAQHILNIAQQATVGATQTRFSNDIGGERGSPKTCWKNVGITM